MIEAVIAVFFIGFGALLYAGRSQAGIFRAPAVDPEQFLRRVIYPALVELEKHTAIPVSKEAARFLLAIALQESGLRSRYQLSRGVGRAGPARNWWQFEAIGVAGVMTQRNSSAYAKQWFEHCWVEFERNAGHRASEGHDIFAAGLARLLVWSSPDALPSTAAHGWRQYLSLWRPGKPHSGTWGGHWRTASETIDSVWSKL